MNIDWNHLIDNSEKVFKIVAVIVGVLWVYSNSIRDWIFGIPRLELEVSGRLLSHRENQFVLITIQVRNVGSSLVRIRAKGTGLKVVSLQSDAQALEAAKLIEKETTAFPVLEKNTVAEMETRSEKFTKEIEPGTTVNEQKLIAVKANKYDAFKLELKVFVLGRSLFWPRAQASLWTAIAIAAKDESVGNA